MDFSFSEAQLAIGELARKLFAERVTQASLDAVEKSESRIDERLWAELASTGLLATAIPEAQGGGGHGLLELASLFVEQGAAVAPVPLFSTLALGALPIARFGTEAQKSRHLAAVVEGRAFLTAALAEVDSLESERPTTRARAEGGGFVLDGAKSLVPNAARSAAIVVPATTESGEVVLALVAPDAPGVSLEPQVVTNESLEWDMSLTGVRVSADDVLVAGAEGAAALEWLVARATVLLAAIELGVAARALALTAAYTTERKQFERPIATFQAVAQRAADAYVDVETQRATLWRAAWLLSEDRPARREVAVAKYFAAEAGHRVVFAAQHLHGGMGFDRGYPLHRHYLWSKHLELTLGGATHQLVRLGAELAR